MFSIIHIEILFTVLRLFWSLGIEWFLICDDDFADGIDTKYPVGQHTIEAALTLANCKRTFSIVVFKTDGRKSPLFVIVVGALVFIQAELTVFTPVNPNFDVVSLLF